MHIIGNERFKGEDENHIFYYVRQRAQAEAEGELTLQEFLVNLTRVKPNQPFSFLSRSSLSPIPKLVVNGRNPRHIRFHALPFAVEGERASPPCSLHIRILQACLVLSLPRPRPLNTNNNHLSLFFNPF
ncbi:hypothetical protein VNO77_01441 [Canavalia gladiata]|uniref:Uncharacterized protein n=1 Tax=Canavalia gladiata TaxID=3824 RepID=A0AAN9R592_CANGL